MTKVLVEATGSCIEGVTLCVVSTFTIDETVAN